jgi:hypothetical protein
LLKNHLDATDPHNTIELITTALTEYVRIATVFTKDETYSRREIQELLNSYIRRDGTKSFTSTQKGVKPTSDYDLATKKYIDDLIYSFIAEADLTNFKTYVENSLNSRAKQVEVFKKTETYSKVQLDLIVQRLVNDAAREAINDHIFSTYHLTILDLETYLSQYVRKVDLNNPDKKEDEYLTLSAFKTLYS